MPGGGRLVFDVSSLARWAGPPGGIVRVEHELLRAWQGDVQPAVFDPDLGRYRSLLPDWRDRLLGDAAALVLSDGPLLARRGWRAWVPRPGDVMLALERRRLTTGSSGLASLIDRVERRAAGLKRHSMQILTADGDRFAYVPAALALGAPIDLSAADTVLAVGYDWLRKTPAQIARLKRETGIRYVVTCYDMIPVLFPEFYRDAEVAGFEAFWRAMTGIADRVLAISARTRDDLLEWAGRARVTAPEVAIVPLGCSIGAADAVFEDRLPEGLTANRFILMVGTIEPRKGHRLLLELWNDLLARNVPQELGFTLVFAGRHGWKTETLAADIARLQGSHFVHLDEVWDARLERLYRDCAFTVMPSRYEGFGLPVVESFAHGKAVVASNGGALPEVVGHRSPCLDLADRQAWLTVLETWMRVPSARAPYEEMIRRSFRRLEWSTAAQAFRQAAECAAPAKEPA